MVGLDQKSARKERVSYQIVADNDDAAYIFLNNNNKNTMIYEVTMVALLLENKKDFMIKKKKKTNKYPKVNKWAVTVSDRESCSSDGKTTQETKVYVIKEHSLHLDLWLLQKTRNRKSQS